MCIYIYIYIYIDFNKGDNKKGVINVKLVIMKEYQAFQIGLKMFF